MRGAGDKRFLVFSPEVGIEVQFLIARTQMMKNETMICSKDGQVRSVVPKCDDAQQIITVRIGKLDLFHH